MSWESPSGEPVPREAVPREAVPLEAVPREPVSWEPLSREPDVSPPVGAGGAGGTAAGPDFAPSAGEASYLPWPPRPGDVAAPRSRRRALAILASVVGGSVALAVLCAGGLVLSVRAADGDLTRAAEQPAVAPTFTLPTPTPFNGTYAVPGNMCLDADFTGMRPLFTMIGDLAAGGNEDKAAGTVTTTCEGTAGNAQGSGVFRLTATVYPSAAAATAAFLALPRDGSTTISTLGEQAYLSTDERGARSVTAVDGNLIISMSWGGSWPGDLSVDKTLAAVCRSTLALLRFR